MNALANNQTLNVLWDDEAASALAVLAETTERYWETRRQLEWN